MSSEPGDGGIGTVVTIDDVRRLLEEQTRRHEADSQRMLDELLLAIRSSSFSPPPSAMPLGGLGVGRPAMPLEPIGQSARAVDQSCDEVRYPSKQSLPSEASCLRGGTAHGHGHGLDGGDRDGASTPPEGRMMEAEPSVAPSTISVASMLRGVKAARFDMAKALGFDAVDEAGETQNPTEGPTECSVHAHVSRPLSRLRFQSNRSTSFISTRAALIAREDFTRFQRFIRSTVFENITGGVICVNAFVIGAHANVRALHPSECFADWEFAFLMFNCFFTLELILRIYVYRFEFVFGPDNRWNFFDSIIVFGGLLEEVIARGLGHSDCVADENSSSSESATVITGITVLRILRALRVVRIIKAIRTMTIFKDLRMMVASTLGCLVPLAWACLLLGFIKWCFSVYFLHIATDSISKAVRELGPEVLTDPAQPYQQLQKYFGSLWLSIYTLFQSITGGLDWEVPCLVLFEATGQIHALLLYVLFIALTLFAVLNVITGVFVENATQVALRDRELMIEAALSNRHRYKDALSEVFREADADHSGMLTAEEFSTHLEDPRVQAFLASLEIDSMGAQRMFRLLDLDGDGLLSSEEFVTGCMCLKGGAKTIDVAALLLEMNTMSGKLSKSIAKIDQRLNSTAELIEQGAPIESAYV